VRLFSLPDGVVNRKDRSSWLTPPFDRAWITPSLVVPPITDAYLDFDFVRSAALDFSFARTCVLDFDHVRNLPLDF
jgi:hypothetical protein